MSPFFHCKMIRYFLFFFLILLLSGCKENRLGTQSAESPVLHPLSVRYARGFRLEKGNGLIQAEVINPWQGKEKATMTYVITSSATDKRYPANVMPIKTPVRRVVCTSTTHIAFLGALGKRNTIVGISGKDYVCDTLVRKKIREGKIRDIGYDKNMNYELILQMHPDVVFLYGIGPEVRNTTDRLASLGIPAVIVGDYLEETPLGRAEWIRFFGAFFEELEAPGRWIDSVAARYETAIWKKSSPDALPTVMTGLPWNEIWYVPGGKTLTAAFIRDAGGRYIWEKIDSRDALPMDIEKVYRTAGNTDLWINCGTAVSRQAILSTDKRLALFRPFQTGRIYNNNARLNPDGGNDYWESGVIHPDIILEDLKQIFHPEKHKGRKLVYYKKIE